MAYLLSELVQYTIARSASHEEVISRLMNAGFEVGRRAVEIVSSRHGPAQAVHGVICNALGLLFLERSCLR